ncbi:MAG: hypothetical protein EOO92_03430 [Pedobacter sp.]|nr:MAG: hypothetical protein EOO92_03430 [Pedobacter sp.]
MHILKKLKEKFWLQIIIIYTRYLLGGAFVFASLIKIKGNRFTTTSGADAPINSAFHFFETMYQSGLYWKFLGLGQLIAGALLMTQRYSKLGAILNFPVILNVFVITLSYDFNYTPVITGTMLLANTILLVWEWNSLRVLVNLPLIPESNNSLSKLAVWTYTGIILFLFTFGYRLITDHYNMLFWMGVSIVIGLIGFIIGMRNWVK